MKYAAILFNWISRDSEIHAPIKEQCTKDFSFCPCTIYNF